MSAATKAPRPAAGLSAQLLAQRPAAEKVIATAAAAMTKANEAKQAALEAGDRTALGAARDDFDQAEFDHAKGTKALAALDAQIAAAQRVEKQEQRRAALAERDRLVVAAKAAVRVEADAFIASVEARMVRAAHLAAATAQQDLAVRLALELGETQPCVSVASPTGDAVADLLEQGQQGTTDPSKRKWIGELILKLAPNRNVVRGLAAVR